MCGIFGILSSKPIDKSLVDELVQHSERRGRDSSGLVKISDSKYSITRSNTKLSSLIAKSDLSNAFLIAGHSRLVTNGLQDNQPVYRDDIIVLHNGIIVNDDAIWKEIGLKRRLEIDTEVIAAIAAKYVSDFEDISKLAEYIIATCKGVVACAILIPKMGKMILFSNNGSMYAGKLHDTIVFASERFPLEKLKCVDIEQVFEKSTIIEIPSSDDVISVSDDAERALPLIPSLGSSLEEEKLLEYNTHSLKRCVKCILPETMPFIKFDTDGICNYCNHYTLRNVPRPVDELFALVEPYRRTNGSECIVPFSGGRDSCYGLHLLVKELKIKPIAYTYDWGMVTDLGRRNISRMCSQLGVENIIVAADIRKKRRNISLNFKAWLKSPDLGMVSILTAGDKHFFKYVETVKRQTGIPLNLWGINPLEVTHFKSGFLGVAPDFEESRVYTSKLQKQLNYQMLRFSKMLRSPGYFNRSLSDTLSGEYYRSISKKSDYFHIFDFWSWDEKVVNETLLEEYDWETATDTSSTWRIGDGTAAMYNYIYYTVAGFTEHDTFRSNQIREGQLSRAEALSLVADENQPRYPNVKWYLDAIGMDFKDVVNVINKIPKMF